MDPNALEDDAPQIVLRRTIQPGHSLREALQSSPLRERTGSHWLPRADHGAESKFLTALASTTSCGATT